MSDPAGDSTGTLTASPACRHRRRAVALCALVLLGVNLAIVGQLFGVEYSAHNGSIEGTFIAIPRVMAKYPGQWSWWPLWNGGIPFENTYLPFTHWIVAAFTLLTGWSAARSFHVVTAAWYAAGAPALFWVAFCFSRKLAASFLAALAYSCLSLSALLVPTVRHDVHGALNLRRLQNLVLYGESPHTAALALLPAVILCFDRALRTNRTSWKVLAGVLAAFVALSNAFGLVALAAALTAWLLVFRSEPWWKAPANVSAIGILSYCWVSPWLSPSLFRAIRANAATSGGDFRYTEPSWVALPIFASGYLLLWFLLRRLKTPAYLQFFALLAYVPAAFVLAWYAWEIPLIPQPARYESELDMALMLAVVFGGAAALDRMSRRARVAVAAVLSAGLAFQTVHSVLYARRLIRSVDPERLSEYKVAKWLDRNRPGERAFLPGSASLLFNVFTDNPQLHGGHDQHTVNSFIPVADFTIRTGMNAGSRDTEISLFWLKVFGVRAVFMPGPKSTEYYRAVVNPRKFEGVLPLLWREGDDAIYGVPGRSSSLAHVIPASAVVMRRPAHGLDIAPVESYVSALDDPRYPLAEFRWKGMSGAEIRATVETGQVISVQVTYEAGWRAYENGRRLRVRPDAIGQMVIEPARAGPCEISLRYTGGAERIVTRAMSLTAMLVALALLRRDRRGMKKPALS